MEPFPNTFYSSGNKFLREVLPDLGISREKYFRFIQNSKIGPFSYKFSTYSSPSPFSRCFAVFGLNLINELTLGSDERTSLSQWIRAGLDELRETRKAQGIDLTNDKKLSTITHFLPYGTKYHRCH